jgi:hypothetical protein
MAGVPFLYAAPGFASAFPNARLLVEIAWGGGIWVDVTTDLDQADGQVITISPMGRADEFSQAQPAACSFVVDNTSLRYSKGPQSSNWPLVRRGTPVRVRLALDGFTFVTRFQGEAKGFKPKTNTRGNVMKVTVTAYGVTRRLQQGKEPLRSPVTRAVLATGSPTLRQYWPGEDGTGATQAASALIGGTPLRADVPVGFAGYDPTNPLISQYTLGIVIGSGKLPQLNKGGRLSASFLAGSSTAWTVQVMTFIDMVTDVSATGGTGEVLTAYEWQCPGSTFPRWQLVCDSTAAAAGINPVRVMAINASGVATEVARITVKATGTAEVRVDAAQVGGNINVTLKSTTITTVNTNSGSIAGTLAGVAGFIADPGQTGYAADFAVGHIRIWDGNTAPDFISTSAAPTAWNSYNGETATARLTRLCAEQGVALTLVGTSTTLMGPQGIDTFLNLLRECEATDLGVLFDGQGAGVSYVARSARYDPPASLTLNAQLGQVDDAFEPEDDDQRTRNLWVVSRKGGSSIPVQDKTGPLGTDAIGVYDAQVTVNNQSDGDLPNIGAWLLHTGTVDEPYRFPKLNLDLAALGSLASGWLAMPVTGRVDVTNAYLVSPQNPPWTISLIVEGWTETLSPHQWKVEANCSPASVQSVAATGAWPLELAGQTLAADLNPGATTLSLATPAGYPLFTTSARFPADFPVDLKVGGWPVHVTAASGSTSPQTLTIDPAINTSPIASGSPVTLLRPVVLAL